MQSNTAVQTVPFSFDGHEIRTQAMPDGEALFVARDVAEALGYARPTKAVQDHCRGVLKRDIPSDSGVQSFSVIREPDVYRLIVKSRLESAERFERWVFEDVLPTIRKTGSYNVSQPVATRSLEDLMKAADIMANSLNLQGSSRITALRAFSAANCPELLPMMPAYAVDAPSTSGVGSSEVTHSASHLLQQHGSPMGAARFNRLCAAHGILSRKWRKNSQGKDVAFWCVTHDGLEYGKNLTSEQSPRSTQPHWYDSKFAGLLELIGA